MFEDLDLKISGLSLYFGYLGEGYKLYVQMPADLDQFGRDNSHGTVIGGKSLVQLGHHPSDCSGALHQIDKIARICKIQ
jgi:hypothetical protein